VYEYATLRVVPSIERGEAMNVGVVLYCQTHDFLGCRTHVDADRLRALAADLDLDGVRHALRAVDAACCADPAAAAGEADEADDQPGPISKQDNKHKQVNRQVSKQDNKQVNKPGDKVEASLGDRFRRLTAPRSTIVQPGPVHPGLTDDPAAELGRLFDVLVG
jgi:hypothetical protein